MSKKAGLVRVPRTIPSAHGAPDLTLVRNESDPGDATARNYRYQHAYGVMLLASAKRGERPYVSLWCEHHEDILAQRQDGVFDGYQIKTSRPENGPWRMTDPELTKSIGRFVELVAEFGGQIGELFFVSNTQFDMVTAVSQDESRRARCPRLFLEHVRACSSPEDISAPFKKTFDSLLVACGCESSPLLNVLHRVGLILGPSRDDFEAVLSHEHLGRIKTCASLSPDQLDTFRDDLVALVYRASSLQVTDPIRHLRSIIGGAGEDPILAGKRIVVNDAVVYRTEGLATSFRFLGDPTLSLTTGLLPNILEQKLVAAGLSEEVEYMHQRALAAEYHLLETIHIQPGFFPATLKQIEERVYGELIEANLRARQQPAPYGPVMLIDVQDRLRNLARNAPAAVGHQEFECLLGVAGLMTGECRIWWGPRFPIAPGAA